MILRMHEGGVYPSELRMHVTQPDGTTIIWDPPSSMAQSLGRMVVLTLY